MWINADRCLYAGLLGAPLQRTLGAYAIYAALNAPIELGIAGDAAQTTALAVVPPYAPHRIACESRSIAVVVIEPETVNRRLLPAFLREGWGAVDEPQALSRIRAAYDRLRRAGADRDFGAGEFDRQLFGAPLAARELDPRIARVVEAIKRNPHERVAGSRHAASVHLSFSRFMHLFKEDVGVPFRSFRSWKRARSLMQYVTQDTNLARVALEAGYPDSTHFSHSIRQVYGLKPTDIFAGSRKLAVFGQPTALAPRRSARRAKP